MFILIVKTSSLGDIIQAFSVLDDLHRRFPFVAIDWAVEAPFYPIVAAHPLVRRAISLDIKKRKNLWSGMRELRREKYDLVFDLQGNCKSGAITLLSRGKVKVGYSFSTVREWPNVLATDIRFKVSRHQNIRTFYLALMECYFQTPRGLSKNKMKHFDSARQSQIEGFRPERGNLSLCGKGDEEGRFGKVAAIRGVRFHIKPEEKEKISRILVKLPSKLRIMVCPGSQWVNKQLRPQTWIAFLQKIEQAYPVSFLLIWGNEAERTLCEELAARLKAAFVVDKLPLPTWQNLMDEVDLVIAVDSSALHLCGTTSTPSFSIFGPTSLQVFKPFGQRHFAIQGRCPYKQEFEKQCPLLRSCPTGACIKELTAEALFEALQNQCDFLLL